MSAPVQVQPWGYLDGQDESPWPPAVYTGGSPSSPTSIAIDASGNPWVANTGNASITQIGSTGTLINFTGAGIASPDAVAINPR